MATTVNITSTYAGQFADEILLKMLKESITLANGGVSVRDGIKKDWTISRMTSTGLIKNKSCAFDPTGTVTFTEKKLAPKDLEVNLELCKDDFRETQFAEQMGAGRNNEMLPRSIQVAIATEVGNQVAQANENDIWHGEDSNGGEFNGFIPLFAADGTVVDTAAGASGGVTSTNVLAEIAKVYNAIPVQLLSKPDLNIYISPLVFRAYQEKMGDGQGYKDEKTVGMKPLNYLGVNLYPTQGLQTSFMCAAQSSNLWFGTDLMGDMSSGAVKFLDQSFTVGGSTVNVELYWAADVNYGFGEEVVLYTPVA